MLSHALNSDVDSVQRETAYGERAHDDSAANDVDDGASLCRGEFPSIVAGFCETCIGGRMEVLLGQKMEIFPTRHSSTRQSGVPVRIPITSWPVMVYRQDDSLGRGYVLNVISGVYSDRDLSHGDFPAL